MHYAEIRDTLTLNDKKRINNSNTNTMSETAIISKHLEEKKQKIKELKGGKDLSVKVFENILEQEKTALLNDYLETYKKAIVKAESLENERAKLESGKKTFEKDSKGEFVEKRTFDEQTVQKMVKVKAQLKSLYEAIDKAMLVGNFDNWKKLENLSK